MSVSKKDIDFGLFVKMTLPGLLIVLYVNYCGVGLTYDSMDYLFTGENLWEHYLLLSRSGGLYLNRAPLFPIVLSIYPRPSVLWVVVPYVISCFAISQLIANTIQDRWLQLLGGLFISMGLPLILVNSFLWSESIFICFLYFYLSILLSSGSSKSLWTISVLGLLISLQRNIGFLLLSLPIFYITYLNRKAAGAFRDLRKLVIPFVAAFGWLAYIHWQGFNTPRLTYSFQQTINYLDFLSRWFIPPLIDLVWRIPIFLLSSAIIILHIRPVAHRIKALGFMVIGYIIFMMFVNSPFDEIERYLSVVFPAMTICLLALFEHWISRSKYHLILRSIVVLLVCYGLTRTLKNAFQWHNQRCTSTEIRLGEDGFKVRSNRLNLPAL